MWGLKKLTKENHKDISTIANVTNRRGVREDRRSFGLPTKFPFFDSLGKLVKIDRRTIPDRRIANIQVKEDRLTFDSKKFKS